MAILKELVLIALLLRAADSSSSPGTCARDGAPLAEKCKGEGPFEEETALLQGFVSEVTKTIQVSGNMDCKTCVTGFVDQGGCNAWAKNEDPTPMIPLGCEDRKDCEAEAAAYCFSDESMGGSGDCETCAAKFDANGGCDLWKSGASEEAIKSAIPGGCDHCEPQAKVRCFGPSNTAERACSTCAAEFLVNGGCARVREGSMFMAIKEFFPSGCGHCPYRPWSCFPIFGGTTGGTIGGTTACGPGSYLVNHLFDNPGMLTCGCDDGTCLTNGNCEQNPKCIVPGVFANGGTIGGTTGGTMPAMTPPLQWTLGGQGLSCTVACNVKGQSCDESALKGVDSEETIMDVASKAGSKCESKNGPAVGWAYDSNPGICTDPECCGDGSCTGICAFGKTVKERTCSDAGVGHYSRLCPCVQGPESPVPPPLEYFEMATGSCSSAGGETITEKSECSAAAKELGFSISWGPNGGYPDVVNGCSVRGGNMLFLNSITDCKEGTIPGSCSCGSMNTCLCKREGGGTIGEPTGGGSGPVPTMTPPYMSTTMPLPGGLQCPPGAHDDGPGMGCFCDSNHEPTTDGSNCGSGGSGPVPTTTPPYMSTMMPPAGGLQCPPGAHDDGPGMGCVCDSTHEPTTDGSNCGSGGSGPVPTMPCLGNPQTWDAGYGLCDTYGSGSGNYGYCSSDCTDGLCADKVCALCGLCGTGPAPTMTPPYMSTMMPPTGGLQCPPGAHDDGPGMGCVCDSSHEPTTDGSNCGSGGSGPVPTMTPPYMPPPLEYFEMATGSCSSAGGETITEKSECSAAAKELGFGISWGPNGGYPDVVNGCSVRGGNMLFLNSITDCKEGTIPGSCSCGSMNTCLCKREGGGTIGEPTGGGTGPVPTMTPPYMSTMMPPP